MRTLAKLGLILLYLAAFFAITTLLAEGFSYLTAESYAQDATPISRSFPVVAVGPSGPTSTGGKYQLIRWSEMEKYRRWASPLSFKLPELHGYFRLPMDGEYQPSVVFKIIETTGDRQLIAVTSMEDDYVFYSKYVTDGNTVWPKSLRIWGPSSAMAALVPGLVLTWLLGRVIAWAWRKRSGVQGTIAG